MSDRHIDPAMMTPLRHARARLTTPETMRSSRALLSRHSREQDGPAGFGLRAWWRRLRFWDTTRAAQALKSTATHARPFGCCLAPLLWFAVCVGHVVGAPDSSPEAPGWSQDLLARLLAAPAETSLAETGGGTLLRSYQLRTMRVGEGGRPSHMVSILERMLPAGSKVTEDRAGNALHILTSASAHEAVLELISAMDSDGPRPPGATEPAVVPEEIRKALESLAATRPDSDRVSEILSQWTRESEQRLSETWRRTNQESWQEIRQGVLFLGGALLVGGGALVALLSYRSRRSRAREITEVARREASALAILPNQSLETVLSFSREQQERSRELQRLMESFSIAFQADRQRSTILLESAAKKQGDLARSLEELQQFRRDLGEGVGRAFIEMNRDAVDRLITQASDQLQQRAEQVGRIAESASRKMDETASRLEVQNARAAALADELERTQKEVDQLFEKLRIAQDDALKAQSEAHEQRRIACEKAAELAKKEAALAGLSLLMQEPVGDILQTLNDAAPEPSASEPGEASAEPALPPSEDVNRAAPDAAEPPCPTSNFTYRISPAA